jgi:hypothetical protein
MRFSDNLIKPKDYIYFWSWLGHSKVLDEDGYPLIVYHGTTIPNMPYHALMQFGTPETENHRLRMAFGEPDEVSTRHLHEDYIEHAEELKFIREHPWGDYEEYDIYPLHSMIIPAFIHIANPLYLSQDIAFFTKKIGHVKAEYVGILLEAGYSENEIKNKTKYEHIEIVSSMLLEKGYDGVCFKNIAEGIGENSWIVLDPIQIYPLFDEQPKVSTIIGKL